MVRSSARFSRLVLIAPLGIKLRGRDERDIADIHAMGVDLVLEEPGRIGVTQRVWRRVATAGEIGRLDRLGKGAGQDIGNGTGSPAIGEEPARIAVVLGLPHPPQAFVHLFGHRHDPFLVALADDAQDATGLVDGGDGRAAASLIRRPQP